MHVFLLLSLCFGAVSAVPAGPHRIVGGSVTTIQNYPSVSAVISAWDGINFAHSCGGAILNQRSILSAAHCFVYVSLNPAFHRFRVGSTWASSGGTVHNVQSLIMHPNFSTMTLDSDIAIMRSATSIVYSDVVASAPIPSATYNLRDNEPVWAAGWGAISLGGPWSEQLRHVQIYTISQDLCRQHYGSRLTENMLCVGVWNVGGRDQCSGDSGGPLYHYGTVVGVCSFGDRCADPRVPGINVRVTRYTAWIEANV